MPLVLIVDTTVFCNVLNITGRNQNRTRAFEEMKGYLERDAHMLLPLPVLFETGNFIAQISDGRVRKAEAERFVEQVKLAIDGRAPWQPIPFLEKQHVGELLDGFPDAAMRECGLVDLSLIQEWERLRAKLPNSRLRIWSYDRHLSAYDTG